ncbi:thiamine ABC transporter substrate-binding protein [Allosaccharopolyspora coralli]|uniref:Thiamine ABC transporter substrate-binding protein n=1 Tax=Allosaccharopolyspora coralli TaxID=2665642 RepID=A0A5Q3Q5U3_9PSEU|nr:thiamine ABC transporter substrate-binding protein [Allosaccharopolyspora coralli]QGK68846.1 thiamine ABC transporter substrate-binding protein [Allosaccharopolyspora coralli]
MYRSLPRTAVRVAVCAAVALLAAGCSLVAAPTATDERTVTVVAHDSFVLDEQVKADFEERSGITLEVRTVGDAGALANQLVLSKAAPLGDVAYGVDSTFASRPLDEGVFVPHESPATQRGPQRYALDPQARLTAVDVGDVCVNIDPAWFAERSIPEPRTLADLTDPRYRDLFAVPDPKTSSPGLAFLLATVATFGEPGWQDYWTKLTANGVELSAGWEEAYNQEFSGSAGQGPKPIVLSYASSPAAEVGADGTPRTRALLDTCYRQVEYAGVLDGAKDPQAAAEVMDFLVSPEFQRTVPEQMYVYPTVEGVALPDGWERAAPQPEQPAELPAEQVEQNRQRWIEQWRALVRG